MIYRLWSGEAITSVVPIFGSKKDSAYTLLLCGFVCMLMIVRLSAALTPVSVAAWRTVAATHTAEAFFVTAVALGAGESQGKNKSRITVLPGSIGEWDSVRHTPVVIFLFIVIANALLFTAVALLVRAAELKYIQRETIRRANANADAAAKQSKSKVAEGSEGAKLTTEEENNKRD